MKIATAGNTLVPAYLALVAKGYTVTCNPANNEAGELWQAVLGENTFIAEDTVTLLGLVALYENRGESWKASDAEIDDFMTKFGD